MIPVLDKNAIKVITMELSPEQAEYVAGVNSIMLEVKNDNPDLEVDSNAPEDILYVAKIMAFADKIKNLHWAADNMDSHKALDDFGEELEEYKDDIAENIQSIIGQFSGNQITKLTLPVGECPLEILDELKRCVADWLELHTEDIEYEGCRNATSSFLEVIHKYIYLLRLCKMKEEA